MSLTFNGNQVTTSDGQTQEVDRRYRILVMLERSDRPKYWTFNCPRCKTEGPEIVNAELQAMSDLIDMETVNNIAIGYRCGGKFCRYWYYFKLGAS